MVDVGHLDVRLSCSSVLRTPHTPALAELLGSVPQSPGPVYLLVHLVPSDLAGSGRECTEVKMYGLCTVLLSICQAGTRPGLHHQEESLKE